MKKFLSVILMLLICVGLLTSCMDTSAPAEEESAEAGEFETEFLEEETRADDEEVIDDENSEYYSLLEGEWVMVSGMTDGWEYTAEEVDFGSEVSFERVGNKLMAHYVLGEQTFDAEVAIFEGDERYNPEDAEWCIEFLYKNTDFEDTDEFYGAMGDENTLHISHYYPMEIPGGESFPGANHNTYVRK